MNRHLIGAIRSKCLITKKFKILKNEYRYVKYLNDTFVRAIHFLFCIDINVYMYHNLVKITPMIE